MKSKSVILKNQSFFPFDDAKVLRNNDSDKSIQRNALFLKRNVECTKIYPLNNGCNNRIYVAAKGYEQPNHEGDEQQ